MLDPIYRLATVDDLAQLVELRVLMQREVNNPKESDVGPAYLEAVHNYFAQNLSSGGYVSAVAEIGGKLVSANGLVIYTKPPSVNGGTGRMGYLSNVYTRSEVRGRGIASELMKLITEYARLNGVDRLHLGATDLGKGVYLRAGFQPPRFTPLELRL